MPFLILFADEGLAGVIAPAVIDIPGIEFAVDDQRPKYLVPDGRTRYTVEDQRLKYQSTEPP